MTDRSVELAAARIAGTALTPIDERVLVRLDVITELVPEKLSHEELPCLPLPIPAGLGINGPHQIPATQELLRLLAEYLRVGWVLKQVLNPLVEEGRSVFAGHGGAGNLFF